METKSEIMGDEDTNYLFYIVEKIIDQQLYNEPLIQVHYIVVVF